MDIRIIPGRLYGEVTAPTSKSSAHRLLICAALAKSESYVEYGDAVSNDIRATVRCLRALGAVIDEDGNGAAVTPIGFGRDCAPHRPVREADGKDCGTPHRSVREADGKDGVPPYRSVSAGDGKGCAPPYRFVREADGKNCAPHRSVREADGKGCVPQPDMDCADSGSTLRFLIPVAAALGGKRRFLLGGRLPERPLSPLKEELCRHGAEISLDGNVLTVCGDNMTGGEFVIDGGVSSQFISGLLFALPLLPDGSFVRVTGRTESRPYIDMTVAALYNYGIKIAEEGGVFSIADRCEKAPARVRAEGDWSGAAFWVCAGALSDAGIIIRGLDPDALQGDRRCVDIVREMGAVVESAGDGIRIRRGNDPLHGISLDAADIPDLVPVCAALAAAAGGKTEITGAARLRLKESDRIESTCRMINSIGGTAHGSDDGITVTGADAGDGFPLRVIADVDSENDHRIAMSAAVLSCVALSPVTIRGAECVSKSYPKFWDDFVSLHGKIEIL